VAGGAEEEEEEEAHEEVAAELASYLVWLFLRPSHCAGSAREPLRPACACACACDVCLLRLC
jgi:hypothetical protein